MAICGIVGTPEQLSTGCRRIEQMLSHLGPAQGNSTLQAVESQVSLGATSPVGTASLWSSREALVVSDADICNADELSKECVSLAQGVNLSYLIACLYLKEGVAFLKRMRGVFSIAIWDRRSRTLMLAVDRFGVKPLCYSVPTSEILFASYPRGVLASGRVDKRVSPQGLVNYLNFGVVPAPLCAFEGITKLPPGNYVIWKNGAARTEAYWDMAYPEDREAPQAQLAEELLQHLEEAVRLNSAGIPNSRLACFLSGGTDSSSIVGLLTRIKREPVNALSIGFSEKRFDELNYAEIVARHFQSRHVASVLGPEETHRILPTIVEGYDEPYGNPSAVPTLYCQTIARERGIEVMLAGDGGDELFGGNERYRTNQVYEIYHKIPPGLRRRVLEPFAFGAPSLVPGIGKVRRYIQASKTPNPDRYFRWNLLQYFRPDRILAEHLPFGNGHGDLLAPARAHYQVAPARSDLNRLLYLDIKMTLGDNDLPKVARTAELAGIKVRFPYLDHLLADFSGRIPAGFKVKGLKKRYLFKQATRNLLPSAVLKKKKHGFGLPIGLWLKNNPQLRGMAQEALLDPRTYQRGYFRRRFIEDMFAAMDHDDTPFYGDILWQFLMMELWQRRHVEGNVS